MTRRFALLSGFLAGAITACAFLGWYGLILSGEVRDSLSGMEAQVVSMARSFDMAAHDADRLETKKEARARRESDRRKDGR